MSQRVLAVKDFLRRGMGMSPMDLLLRLLEDDEDLKTTKARFYRGEDIAYFLRTISKNLEGRKRLDDWLTNSNHALDLVLQKVDNEMSILADNFVVSMNHITPEDLMEFNIKKDIQSVAVRDSPWLHWILLWAAQTDRGRTENKLKDQLPVHTRCIQILSSLFNF